MKLLNWIRESLEKKAPGQFVYKMFQKINRWIKEFCQLIQKRLDLLQAFLGYYAVLANS